MSKSRKQDAKVVPDSSVLLWESTDAPKSDSGSDIIMAASEVNLITPASFSARLVLYKRELWRRALVLFGVVFLPIVLLAAAILIWGGFFPTFAQGVIAFSVTFWLILAVLLVIFYRSARHSLPVKIGLLCPHCHCFLLDVDIEKLSQTGACSQCGMPLLDISRHSRSDRMNESHNY